MLRKLIVTPLTVDRFTKVGEVEIKKEKYGLGRILLLLCILQAGMGGLILFQGDRRFYLFS